MYWFFEETTADPQDVEFTVSKSKYTTTIEDVSVAQGELTRKDFELGSPNFVVSPESLERTIFLGDDDEYDTIYVKNIGTGAGEFGLTEVNKGFQPLYQPVPPRALNIPAFTGELAPRTEPVSIFAAPGAQSAGGTQLELHGNAAKYGITEAPAAVAGEVMNDKLWRWEDLTATTDYAEKGALPDQFFAADFVGQNYAVLYGYSSANKNFYSIDTETAVATVIANIPLPAGTAALTGMTGAEGFLYASATDCDSLTKIMKVELDGTISEVGTMTTSTCAIDLAYVPSENAIYTVDLQSSSLHRFDLGTGTDVMVGALGVSPNYAQGMDYDESNGIMYWAAYVTAAHLRVIDLQTGASELVAAYPANTEIDSLAIEANTGGGAVPWLDEDPIEGTLQEGEVFPIELTFTVKDIEQPGDYFAELRFTADGATPVPPLPVTLHVTRPFTWGNIKGTVLASEKCDLNPAPLAEATVRFYKDGELFKTTTTDENGYYSYALERGTYDVEIVSAEHVTGRVNDVVVPVSDDVVVDFNLRHDSPCLTYEPEMLFAQLYPDQTTDLTLTFRNTGAQDAVFEISEIPGEGPVPYAMADVELALDDGSYDDAVGIGGNSQFIALNRFTPEADMFPFTINEVHVYFETTVQAGDPFEVYLYQNETSQDNPAPGSEFLYKQAATVAALNSWTVIELDEPVTFEGPGDVMIAAGFLKKPGDPYFPASIDETATQSRSWAGWYTGDIPTPPTLPPNDTWTKIDAAGIAGNWMIRGYGESGGGTPGDIPWLELDTTAGVVVADTGELEVIATFDSAGLTWGDYFGQLRVDNAPDPRINIPVQLRILPFNMMYLPIVLRNFR